MALPTTNLTIHCDASDTDNVFTTADVGGGNHSGVPTDGAEVQVWDDEDDGIADISMGSGPYGTYQSTSPLMLHPCIGFDGVDSTYASFNQVEDTHKAASNFVTASAFTILIAFYAEAASLNDSDTYENHGIIADNDGYFGLYLRNTGGTTPTVYAYNWDGGDDSVGIAISLNTSYVAMLRHESGTLYLSLNGGAESSVVTGNTADLTARIFLGLGTLGHFSGRIGEFAIWNAALTGTDLTDAIDYFMDKWISVPVATYAQTAFRWRAFAGGLGAP